MLHFSTYFKLHTLILYNESRGWQYEADNNSPSEAQLVPYCQSILSASFSFTDGWYSCSESWDDCSPSCSRRHNDFKKITPPEVNAHLTGAWNPTKTQQNITESGVYLPTDPLYCSHIPTRCPSHHSGIKESSKSCLTPEILVKMSL